MSVILELLFICFFFVFPHSEFSVSPPPAPPAGRTCQSWSRKDEMLKLNFLLWAQQIARYLSKLASTHPARRLRASKYSAGRREARSPMQASAGGRGAWKMRHNEVSTAEIWEQIMRGLIKVTLAQDVRGKKALRLWLSGRQRRSVEVGSDRRYSATQPFS